MKIPLLITEIIQPLTEKGDQISIWLIGMVSKQSVELIVLAKQWGIILQKAKKTI